MQATGSRVYLDHNASAPLLPQARDAICDALSLEGNPSSVHGHGRKLRNVIEDARELVGKLSGAETRQVVFTGSATEALTQGIVGGQRHFGTKRILISAGEHRAAKAAAAIAGSAEVHSVGLLANGEIDLTALKREIDAADEADELALVVVHAVNNETGVIQNIGQIETLVGPTQHILLVDAVQALGKMDLEFASRAADMMAISAHKIAGPAGVGALLLKAHCNEVRIMPGGGQELGRRGGTESAALIAGFGAACAAYTDNWNVEAARALIDHFENGLRATCPDLVVFGEQSQRVGAVSNCAMPGISNDVVMMGLDIEGISISAGSACSSGKTTGSEVLAAMGVPQDLLNCALRVSVGWNSTASDIEAVLAALTVIYNRQQSRKQQTA